MPHQLQLVAQIVVTDESEQVQAVEMVSEVKYHIRQITVPKTPTRKLFDRCFEWVYSHNLSIRDHRHKTERGSGDPEHFTPVTHQEWKKHQTLERYKSDKPKVQVQAIFVRQVGPIEPWRDILHDSKYLRCVECVLCPWRCSWWDKQKSLG